MTTTTTTAPVTAAQAVPTLDEFAARWHAIDSQRLGLPPLRDSGTDMPARFRARAAIESEHADLLYEVYQASGHVLPNTMLHIAVSDSIEAHRRRAAEYEQSAVAAEQRAPERLQAKLAGGER